MTTLNALKIRRRLGLSRFGAPREFGPDGWIFHGLWNAGSVIVSVAPFDGTDWIHASISDSTSMPTYDDLKLLHAAVFEDRYAFEVYAPPEHHINIHPNARHLWGRLDGASPLPEFGKVLGSI